MAIQRGMDAEILHAETGQQAIFDGAIVIGAGGAGLTAAHALIKAGVPDGAGKGNPAGRALAPAARTAASQHASRSFVAARRCLSRRHPCLSAPNRRHPPSERIQRRRTGCRSSSASLSRRSPSRAITGWCGPAPDRGWRAMSSSPPGATGSLSFRTGKA